MFKNIDMTKGSILKCVLLFALPIFIGNILQQFYAITDTWVVGKYLENGISAIGSSHNIYDLMLCFANGVALGFSLMVSRSFGAKDEKALKKSIALVIVLTISITLLLTVLGLAFLKPILRLLNTPEGVFDMAYSYISIVLGGLITTMLYNMFQHLMRSVGNSFVSLICLSISVILNIGMDFVFVVFFKLGIKGVAIATVVAQALSALFCFIYILIKMPELHVKKEDFKFDGKIFSEVLQLGLTMGFMLSIVSIGNLIMQSAINDLGENIISAHLLGRKVDSLFMVPLSTVASSASTFASQNYGANKLERIKKGLYVNILLGFIWSIVSIVIIFIFGRYFVMWLGSTDNEEVINTAVLFMRWNVPFFGFLSILLIVRNFMQSIGFKIIPIVSSFIELTVKLFVTFVFKPILGYNAVLYSECVIWGTCAIVLCVCFVMSEKGKEILKPINKIEEAL